MCTLFLWSIWTELLWEIIAATLLDMTSIDVGKELTQNCTPNLMLSSLLSEKQPKSNKFNLFLIFMVTVESTYFFYSEWEASSTGIIQAKTPCCFPTLLQNQTTAFFFNNQDFHPKGEEKPKLPEQLQGRLLKAQEMSTHMKYHFMVTTSK